MTHRNMVLTFAETATDADWMEFVEIVREAHQARVKKTRVQAKARFAVGQQASFVDKTGRIRIMQITKICTKNIKGTEISPEGLTIRWTVPATILGNI